MPNRPSGSASPSADVSTLRPGARRRSFFFAAFLALASTATAGGAGPAQPASDEDCLSCHGDSSAKRDDGRSIFVAPKTLARSVHGDAGLACVDCHVDLAKAELPHAARTAKVDCASCHDGAPAAHPFHPDLARADPTASCADCHGGHDVRPVKDARFAFAPSREVSACGKCHGEVERRFLASEHGRPRTAGAKTLTCLSCHREPLTGGAIADASARKQAQERLCISCHVKDEALREQMSSSAGFVASYEKSVHGSALARGDSRAPTCIDCHGAHDARHGFDSSSPVNKMRVQQVCGRCHETESREYDASVHGFALHKGNQDSPACTDCHGEHGILSPSDPRSPVSSANVSVRVCSPCHTSVKVTEKWDLPRDRTQTFADSYHGLAARGGVLEVANCASCHGIHDILPSSDPASRIHAANLAKTCGTAGCHPGANERFALGKVHVVSTPAEQPLLYWISTLYIILIVGVVGGMLVHNLLDFLRKSKRHMQMRRGELVEPPAGRGLYLRMTVGERLQHGCLMVSFVLLVVTGFMLRYPDSWWVVALRRFSPTAFDVRSLVHRISAVVMVAASLYHIAYLAGTARGRQFLRDIWWRRQDLRDLAAVLKYNTGRTSERPRFDRFSYVEKSEYWALVWGTALMGVTGTIMWFDNTFIGLLTKLGYDVSRVIHFYEAWLATLAILVWHLYYVIFNPDIYPMNMAWLTGKLTEREMEDEHPLELERIRERAEPPEGTEEPGPAPERGPEDAPR
jgi:cytochrome b subunit of formate dehydrogenase